MTYELEARKIAAAIREGATRDAEQRGTGRYTAEIKRWDGPESFQVDVVGLDLELDEGFVTVSQAVRAYDLAPGVEVGDSLVLVEVDEGEFSAVAVESGTSLTEPVDPAAVDDLQEALAAALETIADLEDRLSALESVREVSGSVAADGSESSSEFSVTKNGTGDYTVTFTTPFGATPVVVPGKDQTGSANIAKLHASTPPSAGGFRVFTLVGSTGAATDGGFTFIARGQP